MKKSYETNETNICTGNIKKLPLINNIIYHHILDIYSINIINKGKFLGSLDDSFLL